MKFHVALLLALVSAELLFEANAKIFSGVLVKNINIAPNDYIENTETNGRIKFISPITADDPLLVSADVTLTSTGETVYSTKNLNMCSNEYDRTSWDYLIVKFFVDTIIPGRRGRKCPVKSPQIYDTQSGSEFAKTDLSDELEYGNYRIEYVVKSSKGDEVFSNIRIAFSYNEQVQ